MESEVLRSLGIIGIIVALCVATYSGARLQKAQDNKDCSPVPYFYKIIVEDDGRHTSIGRGKTSLEAERNASIVFELKWDKGDD